MSNNFIRTAERNKLLPGRNKNLQLADGECVLVLFDARSQPVGARGNSSAATAMLCEFDQKGNFQFWEAVTVYLSDADLQAIGEAIEAHNPVGQRLVFEAAQLVEPLPPARQYKSKLTGETVTERRFLQFTPWGVGSAAQVDAVMQTLPQSPWSTSTQLPARKAPPPPPPVSDGK